MSELAKGDFSKLPWHELGFMKESYLDGEGARLHFAQCSATNSDAMPTIVFLHGVLRNWRSFYPLLKNLRGHANLVSIDFRGHGRSDPTPNSYFVVNYVEDAIRLVTSLNRQVVLYGHSLGAMVALATAARLPEQIKTTILEDPPFSTMGSELGTTPLMNYFREIESAVQNEKCKTAIQLGMTNSEASIERLFEAFSNIPVGIRADGEIIRLRNQRDAISRRFSAEGLAQIDLQVLAPITAGKWLDGFDWKSLLPSIKSQVVLLQADGDCGGMLSKDDADRIMQPLAGLCELVYFRGTGHSIHWAKPQELTQLIRNHW